MSPAHRIFAWLFKSILRAGLTAVGVAFYGLGLAGPLIRSRRASPKVLMYHAVEETESDFTRGLSVNTTPSQFASHLDFLGRHYRVAALNELSVDAPTAPTVAITFDDGFRSAYENAFPRLKARGFTASFYLTTCVIGNDNLIWLNELNWFLHRHGSHSRRVVSEWLGARDGAPIGSLQHGLVERYDKGGVERLLGRLRAELRVDTGELARASRLHLDWEEVAEMSGAGMSFGNHTASHPPLSALPSQACREEIEVAGERLAHLPGASETLAYPFGNRNEGVRAAALALGVRSLLEVEGVNDPFEPLSIGRIKVSAISPAVLFARMEVVEPVTAWLKRVLGTKRP